MSGSIDIVIQSGCEREGVPSDKQLDAWARHVLTQFEATGEATIRIVGDEEMQALNREYRQQDKLTNVLSFEVEKDVRALHGLLGDVVVCASVVQREAQQQGKSLDAHWAHLVMHGVLHLLGFDHLTEEQAHKMELHEIEFLAGFGYADPYQSHLITQQGNQHV